MQQCTAVIYRLACRVYLRAPQHSDAPRCNPASFHEMEYWKMSNDQSHIQVGVGGTMFVGQDATNLFRAMSLASSHGLYAKCGMIPTRGVTITRMLAMATEYTGKKYKRGEAAKAQADVKIWCETMKAALPVVLA